jgi:hypothetical protein
MSGTGKVNILTNAVVPTALYTLLQVIKRTLQLARHFCGSSNLLLNNLSSGVKTKGEISETSQGKR